MFHRPAMLPGMTVTLWIGARKGAFALREPSRHHARRLSGPQFPGHVMHHIVQDPREPRRLLMAAGTGHLGPTGYRSRDGGRHWQEAAAPPPYRAARAGEQPCALERALAAAVAPGDAVHLLWALSGG